MIYFDNSATNRFIPYQVLRAVRRELKYPTNSGRSGHNDSISASMRLHETREEVKRLLNNEKCQVVFTKNCTEALNLAILGTLKEGRHVVTSCMEHNSVLRPLFELSRRGLISLTVIEPKEKSVSPNDLKKAINKDTYLLAITGASNVNGKKNDLKALGKIASEYGLLFLCDGAQLLGKENIDMRACGIDMIACPAYKGLHGIQGAGFLAFAKSVQINPILYGGTGTESNRLLQPVNTPESLESGTLNTPSISAMGEGIKWTIANFEKVNKKIKFLQDIIINYMKGNNKIRIFAEDDMGIISFSVKGKSPNEIADILNERFDIAVRSGLHCAPLMHKFLGTEKEGLVRVSIGFENSEDDALKLIKALDKIV